MSELTEKMLRDAISALEKAEWQCPRCKRWFKSTEAPEFLEASKDSIYMNQICKKCYLETP